MDMNKICGYSCEHNKGGVCQITMCDKKIVMTTTTNEPFEKRFNVKYDEQGVEKFNRWLGPTIEEYKKEIDRLNNLNKQLVEECQRLDDEETRLNNIISQIENLVINHNCDTGDIYYKYNGKYLKSELKERIIELVELKENK